MADAKTKTVRVSWFHTETFERDFEVPIDFDMEDDEQHEELMEQIANLDHAEMTAAFEGCTEREITEVIPIEENPGLPLILAMDDDYCPKSADNTHQFGEDRSCDLCGAKEEA
jgi:hypothetical protein